MFCWLEPGRIGSLKSSSGHSSVCLKYMSKQAFSSTLCLANASSKLQFTRALNMVDQLTTGLVFHFSCFPFISLRKISNKQLIRCYSQYSNYPQTESIFQNSGILFRSKIAAGTFRYFRI